MTSTNTLFGWAFGDGARAEDKDYLASLRQDALENARQEAARKGVDVVPDSADFTLVSDEGSLIDLGEAGQNRIVVRCTVDVTGPGAGQLRAEGPMNG